MPFDSTTYAEPLTETELVLAKAEDYLQRGWCQNALARDADGTAVKPTASNATERCLVGALHAAAYDLYGNGHKRGNSQQILRQVIRSSSLADWNNRPKRRQKEVYRAVQRARAIAAEEAK